MIVVDASVAISWFLDDESDRFADESSERVVREGALVPAIFPAEVANALFFAVKRGRIAHDDVASAIDRMAELPIHVDAGRLNLHEERSLAREHNLTIYDSMYLALAKRHRLPLLTRDAALQRASASE